MTVRRANPQDAQALWQLNREFNGDTGASVGHIARQIAENGCEIALIAEMDGEPVGFACARVCSSLCYPDRVGELTEMYVCERARRSGVGFALVNAAIDALREAGAGDITVLTGDENLAAQALYEKCGFRPSSERHYEL